MLEVNDMMSEEASSGCGGSISEMARCEGKNFLRIVSHRSKKANY